MKVFSNGIDMNVEMSGAGENTVVFSHALGTNLRIWDSQMNFFSSHYRVLRYDIRGHGSTSATDGAYTIEQLSDDVIQLLDKMGIDKFHWVGVSIGAMIGMCIGLNHAERLRSLTLSNTTAKSPQKVKEDRVSRIQTAREKGMAGLVEPMLTRWFNPDYRYNKEHAIASIRNQFLATSVDGYIGCCLAIQSLNYVDRLGKISLPTLIMTGDEDQATPISTAKEISQRIPGSNMVVLESCGHVPSLEQPEKFNYEVMKFIQSCS